MAYFPVLGLGGSDEGLGVDVGFFGMWFCVCVHSHLHLQEQIIGL